MLVNDRRRVAEDGSHMFDLSPFLQQLDRQHVPIHMWMPFHVGKRKQSLECALPGRDERLDLAFPGPEVER